jgi:DNA-binding NarL/FixJ family response regulator
MTLSPKGPKLMLDEPENPESVEDLVRKIVQKVQDANISADSEPSAPILVVDVDGFQYTLLRSQSTETCHLSPREKEIVRLVAEGLPNKCIGAVLDISCWTVATHVQRIFSKLGVTSRAAMVARFIGPGLGQQSARPPTERKIVASQPKTKTDGGRVLKIHSGA